LIDFGKEFAYDVDCGRHGKNNSSWTYYLSSTNI